MKNVVIVGGGAAGFFAAIACAEANPGASVTILERSNKLLEKVKISGGGRCNTTHACYDAKQLVKFYPRGEKQLLGPFTRFNPTHTVDWFEARGVELKTEEDGRMFPVTDSSQTIIDCLSNAAKDAGVKVKTQIGVEDLKQQSGKWIVTTDSNYQLEADAVIITAGSSPKVWSMLEKLGHTIVPPVPSLFTFNIKDERIKGLEGLSVPLANVTVLNSKNKLAASGPLLITHWGMSGPAILRLSAWGARELAEVRHKFEIEVNWTGKQKPAEITEGIQQYKKANPKKTVLSNPLFGLPKRLWEKLVAASNISGQLNFADLSNKHIEQLSSSIGACRFSVFGKSTFKDEFVTAGGVNLDEVDFKTMQSKKFPGMYFAGEVLDIDAITGGFNFQAAWTTGWIAGNSV